MFYRGGNKALVDEELTSLKSQLKQAMNTSKQPGLRDLIGDSANRRALIIALGLMGGQQLCGIFAMINYASNIFKMSGSTMDADTCAIIIGVIQIIGSYLSTSLVERAGRRGLILTSLLIMFVCHVALGSYCMALSYDIEMPSLSLLPILALSTFMIAYCLGMGAVPFVIASETFRAEISSLANSIFSMELWFCAFLMVKFFNSVSAVIGVGTCFLGLSTVCLGTLVFTIFFVPETKGRKIEDIVNELSISFRFNPRKHMAINSDKAPNGEDSQV